MIEFGADSLETAENTNTPPFVLSINDDEENCLSITIALAVRGDKGGDTDESLPSDETGERIGKLIKAAYPVCEDLDNVFEITFENYVIYQCRNESYTGYDAEEVGRGKYLIIYEKSRLLDYYQNVIIDPWRGEELPGRKHYGVIAVNHVIDVISNEPPVIREIEAGKDGTAF